MVYDWNWRRVKESMWKSCNAKNFGWFIRCYYRNLYSQQGDNARVYMHRPKGAHVFGPVKLETGVYIPADGIYFSGHGLSTDEVSTYLLFVFTLTFFLFKSSMTGELEVVKKSVDRDPWLLGDTMVGFPLLREAPKKLIYLFQVTEGSAHMVIIAVGEFSQSGKDQIQS